MSIKSALEESCENSKTTVQARHVHLISLQHKDLKIVYKGFSVSIFCSSLCFSYSFYVSMVRE